MQKKMLSFAAVLGWMTVIFAFSSQPGEDSSQISECVSYQLVEGCDSLFQLQQTRQEKEQVALRIDFPVRKAAHMSEYALLSLLLLMMFLLYSRREPGKKKLYYAVLCAVGCVILYACTDEFHQLFVPGRAGRVTDVLIDTGGAVPALAVAAFVLGRRYKKNENRKS